jgi:asparagine N-glycosylation enzyme membrane subunit Stt3
MVWWGREGALSSMTLPGVTGLQVTLTLATASFAALLHAMARRWPSGGSGVRLVQLALAAIVPALALLAVPGLRGGVDHGLTALTSRTAWYRQILEFRPLLGLGPEPLPERLLGVLADLGAVPLLMVLAVPGLRRRWRERPGEREAVLLLSLLGAAFVGLTLFRARFLLYLTVPAVLLSMAYATAGRGALARRLTFAAFAALALPMAVHASLQRPVTSSFVDEELIAALRWLRDEAPSRPSQDGVLARWVWGHAIQYYAGKPVVVDPFGTDVSTDAMADEAAFFLASDPDEALEILTRRRVGFLLLDDPVFSAYHALGFAPAGAPRVVTATYRPRTGEELRPTDAFDELVVSRLYLADGLPRGDRPALDRYRLVFESPPRAPIPWISQGPFRIFEVVRGAELEVTGARPLSTVTVSIDVRTNQGRAFRWTTSRTADDSGAASLRVPYVTGRNGASVAGPAVISSPDARREVTVPPGAVERGDRLPVALERLRAGPRRERDAGPRGVAGRTLPFRPAWLPP